MRCHASGSQRKFNRHWQSENKTPWYDVFGYMGTRSYTTNINLWDYTGALCPVNNPAGIATQGVYCYEINTAVTPYGYVYQNSGRFYGGCYDGQRYTSNNSTLQALGGMIRPTTSADYFDVSIDGDWLAYYYDSNGSLIGTQTISDYQISLQYAHELADVYYYLNAADYRNNPTLPPQHISVPQVWWTQTSNGTNTRLTYETPYTLALSTSDLATLHGKPCFIVGGSSFYLLEAPVVRFTHNNTPPTGTTRTWFYFDFDITIEFGVLL